MFINILLPKTKHQEKRKIDKTKEGEKRRNWIGAEGEAFHADPGNLCANRGNRTEYKTEGRIKERNREWVPNPAFWIIRSPITTRMDHMGGLF